MFKAIINNTFIRFLLVGALNTVFGYLIFSIVIYFFKNLYVSVVLSNIIGILFNFNTYGKFVFNSKDKSKIYKFVFVYLLVISLQIISMKALHLYGITNVYVAGGIVILPIAALSYLFLKKFVFNTNTKLSGDSFVK